MTRPRAVVACPSLPYPPVSGGRKRALRLIEAIDRAGARPHVLALAGSPEQIADLRDRGWEAEVHPHGTSRLQPLRRLRQDLHGEPEPHHPVLAARIADLSRGAAIVQMEEAWLEQYMPSVPAGPLRVVSPHNADAEMLESFARAESGREALRLRIRARRLGRTERRAVRAADLTVTVSEHDDAYFRGLGARRTVLVPNGVDDELFDLDPASGEPGRVLFFGAYHWAPNRDGLTRFLREGWRDVAAGHPGARLRIVGSGPLEAVNAAAAGLPGVEVAGLVDDIVAEIAAAQVVVVPVWTGGGTRIKVLEAMAAARPIVGTRVGVERIGFQDREHGLLGETPTELAAGLVELLADPARCVASGAAARVAVQSFGWSALAAPLEERYRAAVESVR
ncbi:MAG: glycosyltransferase [Solirubrobacteraceae bacterium]|nr:glycosyltransferase [Solirubrobacteraceae bacterium]